MFKKINIEVLYNSNKNENNILLYYFGSIIMNYKKDVINIIE